VEVPDHRDRQLWRYRLWRRSPAAFGTYPGARRWVVERTCAWLSQARHLSKDHERLLETGEAVIYGVMSRIMLRRLTRAA
jgi:transposase